MQQPGRPLPVISAAPPSHPSPNCCSPPTTAGISTSPGISSAIGDTSGAEIKVLRPDTMADDAVATYLIQAFSDDQGATKVGMAGARAGCCAACVPGVAAAAHAGLRVWEHGPAHLPRARSPTPCSQFGEEVKGSNTDPNADGKTPATAFVFDYPYTSAAKLWFKVTVVVGGTRSDASGIYGPVIMGEQHGPSGCGC